MSAIDQSRTLLAIKGLDQCHRVRRRRARLFRRRNTTLREDGPRSEDRRSRRGGTGSVPARLQPRNRSSIQALARETRRGVCGHRTRRQPDQGPRAWPRLRRMLPHIHYNVRAADLRTRTCFVPRPSVPRPLPSNASMFNAAVVSGERGHKLSFASLYSIKESEFSGPFLELIRKLHFLISHEIGFTLGEQENQKASDQRLGTSASDRMPLSTAPHQVRSARQIGAEAIGVAPHSGRWRDAAASDGGSLDNVDIAVFLLGCSTNRTDLVQVVAVSDSSSL
jgi:hypothetical protein